MSASGQSEINAALAALARIRDYVGAGRAESARSSDRQLALVFLWANVGSLLKQFCRRTDIPRGTDPFAGPIKMRDRLIYSSVATLDREIVWDTCVIDGPRLRRVLSDLAAAV